MPDLPIPPVAPGAPILEHDFKEAMRRALSAPGRSTRVWVQNTGGVVTRDRAGRVTGRFRAGPVTGAADLSGIVRPSGRRLEVEVKVDHKVTPEQVTFGAFINAFGGVYVVVKYNHAMSLAENVAAGVAQVDAAIG